MTIDLQSLLRGGHSLSRWYADPATTARAARRLARAADRRRPAGGGALSRLIARAADALPEEWDYRRALFAAGTGRRARALVELVYGQLLMSRRHADALVHLERAVHLAGSLLAPRDYFLLRKRHRLLGRLPARAAPAPPATLEALLREALVIERLAPATGPVGPRARNSADIVC